MTLPFLSRLIAAVALVSYAVADREDDVCYSYGVDYVDEGHYFINAASSEQFTCVSTFRGCKSGKDFAEILFVNPNGEEYLCSEVPTTPDNTTQLSTCPFMKNQMISGTNLVLVFGNNNDGNPFAWERDLYLDVGIQVTETFTPTVSFSITSTPVITSTETSTLDLTSTFDPSITHTLPSKTAKITKTVIPPAVFTTRTHTITVPRFTWTKELSIITKTITESCTTPAWNSHKQDKICRYSPTLVHPAALETPTGSPSSKGPNSRFGMRRSDRVVPISYARARIDAAKARRDKKAKAMPYDKRAPDTPTITITALEPVNTTITYTAAPSTVIESTVLSATTTVTLPPVTVYSGIYTSTKTLPTPTKTRISFSRTTNTITKTIRAKWTKTVITTPTASVSACRRLGGHF